MGEILNDGENALLFAPDDPESLKDALHRLVVDSGLRQRVGAAGRATIGTRNLTWDGNAAAIVHVFARKTATISDAPGEILEGIGPAALR